MRKRHGVVRDGLVSGLLGAAGVALWFLLVDTFEGRPLHTPAVLGDAVLRVLEPSPDFSPLVNAAFYTVVHVAAFVLVGTLAAVIIHRARRDPNVLAGLLILFVAFEVGFYGFVALLSQPSLLGDLAWYQILIGNVIATLLMGGYLWRTHPELRGEFQQALSGAE